MRRRIGKLMNIITIGMAGLVLGASYVHYSTCHMEDGLWATLTFFLSFFLACMSFLGINLGLNGVIDEIVGTE